MENKAHALAAGGFVLLVAALLVALAVWLTRDSGAQRIYEVATREAVAGLQPQAVVQFRGVRVGKVVNIGFDQRVPGQVLLRLALDEETPITRSSYAMLGFQGVTGIAFVQLDDSGESTELLSSDPEQPARLPLRPGLVGRLSEQGTRVLTQLEETSRRVNQLLDAGNQQRLMSSIGALGQAAASLPPLMQQAGAALASMRETGASLAASAGQVGQAATEYGRLAHGLRQPDGVLDQLGQGAATLTQTGQALLSTTLPRIHQSAEEAAWAARQLGQAAATLKANPQALLFGNGVPAPGPGEPGFTAPGGKP